LCSSLFFFFLLAALLVALALLVLVLLLLLALALLVLLVFLVLLVLLALLRILLALLRILLVTHHASPVDGVESDAGKPTLGIAALPPCAVESQRVNASRMYVNSSELSAFFVTLLSHSR
jgi:hypothetical protein